ncbi:amino acid ABC transporter substrate-binding protein [Clostridium sp. 19966]|uniref:ABC transporter substrate-binding protein n=1 Tax=Clostridium sp. 19966 TaxID=2768166 RepID=UPI0028DE0490|nr:ABC transporter substrate-binding protein [Clostridium sp. 19966]MDT8717321.1 amino acid ABC transporter substrate-binding protein [Clostridium sp. 19966]
MKKILSLLMVLTVGTAIMAGCSKKDQYANSLEKVQKTKKITIGIDPTYPPMEFKDESNKLVGFDIEMATDVAKKLGATPEFVPTSWDGIFMSLKSKKFDVIHSSVSVTDERKKEMIFTQSYVTGGATIYVKKGGPSIVTTDDLKGKVVACQSGTTAEDALSKLSGMKEVKKFDAMTDAFLDLQSGRVDVVASDPMVGDYYVSKDPTKYEKAKLVLAKEDIAVAFRPEETKLRDEYDKAISDLKADGTLSKLSEKWFGYDIYK